MAIGARIQQKLNELGWERKDLLEAVDGLTQQALSNLIRRDSKRSEWDEAIACALGMHVMELVYGKPPGAWDSPKVTNLPVQEPKPLPYSNLAIQLAELADQMDDNGKWELIGTAKVLVRLHPKAKQNHAS